MPTFALNFSRSGNQIVGQYYNFTRLGFEGYRRVQQSALTTGGFHPRPVVRRVHHPLWMNRAAPHERNRPIGMTSRARRLG